MEPRFDLMANELSTKIAKRIYGAAQLIEQSPLARGTQNLVMLRASQINGCGFCVDFHAKEAAAAEESATRLHLVAAWRHSNVFTEGERAALAFTEEATRLADASTGVSDETWARVREHYDDDQTAALIYLVALINASNRLGVVVNNLGGSYVPGLFADMAN